MKNNTNGKLTIIYQLLMVNYASEPIWAIDILKTMHHLSMDGSNTYFIERNAVN